MDFLQDLKIFETFVTEIFALYAAVISTYTLYLVLKLRRPNIKVSVAGGREGGTADNIITITAVNKSSRPVTVTSFGIIDPSGKKMMLAGNDAHTKPELPARLREGQVCQGFFNLEANLPHFMQYGRKIIVQGLYYDAEKREFISEPVEVDLPLLPDNVKFLMRPGANSKEN